MARRDGNSPSFAEQLATRVQPYLDSIREEIVNKGVEAFDKYLEDIDNQYNTSLRFINQGLSTMNRRLDDLTEFVGEIDAKTSDENKTTFAVASQTQDTLDKHIAAVDKKEKQDKEEGKKIDKENAEFEGSIKLGFLTIESSLKRHDEDFKKSEKERKSFWNTTLGKILKFFLGGALVMTIIKHFKDLGLGQIVNNLQTNFQKNFPEIHNWFKKIQDNINNVWKDVKAIIISVASIKRGLSPAQHDAKYWYAKLKDAGYGVGSESLDEHIAQSVMQENGFSEFDRPGFNRAVKKLDNARAHHIIPDNIPLSSILQQHPDFVNVQPDSELDSLKSLGSSTTFDAESSSGKQVEVVEREGKYYMSSSSYAIMYNNQAHEFTE